MVRHLASLLLVTVVACGSRQPASSSTPTPEEAQPDAGAPAAIDAGPPEARIRLIHAAVEERESAVVLVADEGASTEPAGFEFASSYLALSPGDHAISARSNDVELIGASFPLPEGLSTIIAYSTADFPVALAPAPDPTSPAQPDSARLRFFHAIVGVGAVDICLAPVTPHGDGTPIAPGVAAGSLHVAGYVTAPSNGELALQVRAQNTVPCHGRPLGTARFTPASESNYTLVLVGRVGRRRVPLELLFCADPPAVDTSCASVVMEAH